MAKNIAVQSSFDWFNSIERTSTLNTKLMAQRTTNRYGKLGTIHSNQANFSVDRNKKNGQFVARVIK